VESFGYTSEDGDGADPPRWTARDVRFGEITRFTVLHDGAVWGDVETPLAGAFSVRNCLAAIAAAHAVGADPAGVQQALRSYRSVRRRMEVRGVIDDIVVIDDFAHHPTAVRETLAAARQKYAGRRIMAIFEPRSYTAQRREFEDDYAAAFEVADDIVIAGLFHPERYDESTAMDPHRLVAHWTAAGKDAAYIPVIDDIVARTAARAAPGDVVMIMSNGGFGGIHDKLLRVLRDRVRG
jgi:UDP-N-acetylmuramate: L-alanyl-gamma-D-glutamyl-meso-diaminopimelate ligase